MAPASLLTHRDRAHQRLTENIRQAVLEGVNRHDLDEIVQVVAAGGSLTAANDAVLALRRAHRLTRSQAA